MSAPIPLPDAFSGASIILPAVTETESVDETARILQKTCDEDINEVIAVVCDRTTPESRARCEALADVFGDRVRIHHQKLPFLGGAMREAFELATADHVVMMATDLETDPWIVPDFIAQSKIKPAAIVTASRWVSGGGFSGYGPHRVAANWVFQHLVSVLYRSKVTDATFGFRLFPTALVRGINWDGLRHEFLLETVLKPLRLGVEVVEVPTKWKPREDGESQNSLAMQARYIPTLFQNRFIARSAILVAPPVSTQP